METQLLEVLAKSGLTRGLKQPHLLQYQIQEFAAGEYICRMGDEANELWIVVEGSVDVEINDYPLRLPSFHPYQLMGEKGVIGIFKQRIAPLKAAAHITKLLMIRGEDVDTHPEVHLIYKNIAAINSSRVETAHKELESLARDRRDKSELLRRYVGTDILNRRELRPESFTSCSDEEVVIFFSDIVGFSTWSDGREAAEVASFLRGTLRLQSKAINNNGGFIDKYIGDGVMAYWPIFAGLRQEACTRALNAAIEIIRELAEIPMNAHHAQARIGLHVGKVFAGEFGTMERVQYTIVGTAVNLAARLEQVKTGIFDGKEIQLGPIKISGDFFANLPEKQQKNLNGPFVGQMKGVGEHPIYTLRNFDELP